MRRFAFLIAAGIILFLPHTLAAQQGETWVVSWVASAHGPYPVGNSSAQPDQRFAFPSAQTGANDQTFRLIVRPDIWGRQARLRLSNVFGTKAVTFDDVFVGLQMAGPALVKGTNQPVTFGGKASVTVRRGARSGATAFNSVSRAIRPSLPDASSPSASTLRARAAR